MMHCSSATGGGRAGLPRVPGRPLRAPGRPLFAPGRPLFAPGRPLFAPGRPLFAPGRPQRAPSIAIGALSTHACARSGRA
jgi:hypothetical protein